MCVRVARSLFAILCTLAARGAAVELPPPDWDAVGAQAAYNLAEYVRIDTQNPPGRTVEAADFLEQRLRRAGLHTERVMANREKPFVIGRLRGTAKDPKPIVLLNHMDVVPADPTKWSFPPLSGEIRDGVLYGRGTIDMKGFGIVQLAALQLLATRKEYPKHDIVFLAVPDEEVGGSEGMEWFAKHRDDVMNATAVWDEGGVGFVGVFPRTMFFIAVTEKKVLWLRLIAHGRAGHGSRPFPDSAPLRLQQALERILTQPPAPHLTPVVATTFARIGETMTGMQGFTLRHLSNTLVWSLARGQLIANPLTDASIRDTVALTVLNAGYKPNVIPERAEAVLDCRLLPDTDKDAFLTQLRRTVADDSIDIEIIEASESAMISPTDNPLFEAMQRSIATVYPDSISAPFMSVAGTDSRVFRRRGVPAYGLVPMPLTQDLIDTMHGIDERLPVSMLGPAVRIVYEALRQL